MSIKNSFNGQNVILNLDNNYCTSENEIFSSDFFQEIVSFYLSKLKKDSINLYNYINASSYQDLIETLKDILACNSKSNNYFLKSKNLLIEFCEGLFNFWKKFSRYSFIFQKNEKIDNSKFISDTERFNELLLKLYNTIMENLKNEKFNIFRNFTAGCNASIILNNNKVNYPAKYSTLENIPFIEQINLRPPFIINSLCNTRTGYFEEKNINPVSDPLFDPTKYIVYPAWVGTSLSYVYIHFDYLHQGIALGNLFKLACKDEIKNRKPDLIYIFGLKENSDVDAYYYIDNENDLLIGSINNTPKADYFGYMKKMLLTLHNLNMIKKSLLPIHGVGVKITHNNITRNVVIIGDSGAGKSETIEALKSLGYNNLEIIYDDMGVFKIIDNKVYTSGTEIGAFVRLDDLDPGFSFNEMDRAIFINPSKKNARVVIPVNTLEKVNDNYLVDMVFYANNYDEVNDDVIEVFKDLKDALPVFERGRRMAKGTTSEVGISDTFFANPFGPFQKMEEAKILLDKYFALLFENKITIGEIKTRLALNGYEKTGPLASAQALIDFLK